MKTAIMVLAAGAARRFGSPKQLLPLGSRTLLGQVVANARRSQADRTLVVLGRAADEIVSKVELQGVEVVRNPGFESGCGGSIRAGVEAVGDVDGLVLVLGDQPGVSSEIIDGALDAFREAPSWGQLTEYRDGLGHPFVFSQPAFSELRTLKGDKALWKIIEADRSRVRRWLWDGPIPPDVDRPEDYQRLLRAWGEERPLKSQP